MTNSRVGHIFIGPLLLALGVTVVGLYASPREPVATEAARCAPVGARHDCTKPKTTPTSIGTPTSTATTCIGCPGTNTSTTRLPTPTWTPTPCDPCPPTNTPTPSPTNTCQAAPSCVIQLTCQAMPEGCTPTNTPTTPDTPTVTDTPTITPTPTDTPTPCDGCPPPDTATATPTPACFGLLTAAAPAGTSVLQITNDACVEGSYLLLSPNEETAEVVQIATADGLTLTLVSPLTFSHADGESYMSTAAPG